MDDERDDDEDARVILGRRELLLAAALAGTAMASAPAVAQPCLSPPMPEPRTRFSPEPGRRYTPLERVPEVIRTRLQNNSIYAAGGGLTSTPWRVVLSLYGAVYAGVGDQAGAASHERLTHEWSARISDPELHRIVMVADRAWREQQPPNLHPTADYDEVVALRDPSGVFFAQGFGRFRGGALAELVAIVRRTADAHRPPT